MIVESALVRVFLPITVTFVVFAAFWLVARRINPWLLYPGSIALLGHAAVAVFVLPELPFAWDITKFHTVAVAILNGEPTAASVQVSAFGAFQSLIYSAFAPYPVAVGIVNGLLAVMIAVVVRDLATRLYPAIESTKMLTLVVLFLPLPFLYLTIPMRDSLSFLIFFTILATLLRSYATGQWWPTLLAIPLFAMLRLLRPELALVTLVGIVPAAGVVLIQRFTRQSIPVRTFVTAAAPLGLAVAPVLGPQLPVSEINRQIVKRTRGSAAYLEGTTFDGWIDLVLAAPARAIYFQFAPFPLHVSRVFHLIAVLMLPLLVVLAVAAYRAARACDRDIVVLAFLATVYVVGVTGYGLVDANFGTTARHRIPFTFLLCVFAAPVFERWEHRIELRFGIATKGVGE
jgi:hypothetical protein